MLKRVCLAAAFIVAVAAPAFAAGECGPQPIPPAFPTAGDIAAKPVEAARADVLDSYRQIKAYQTSLKSFRSCLEQMAKADNDEIAAAKAKPDANPDDAKAKAAAATQRLEDRQKIYDKSVDTEQQVANDFNTLHLAHCTRDTDPKICPQKK